MLQHFQNKQDLSWKQPTEQTVKTSISKQLSTTLDDTTIPDDMKVKNYSHNLNRFLRTKREIEVENQPTIDELLDVPLNKKAKRVSKKRKSPMQRQKSLRIKKKPRRFADIDWERW